MTPHKFRDYQRRALDYAIPRQRIALFMEMRLGKSPVSIRWAKAHNAERVLLVAPLSTLLGQLNWQGELRREGINPVLLPHVPKAQRMTVLRPTRLIREIVKATFDDGFSRPPHDTTWTGRYRLTHRWAPGWFCINYEAIRTQPELLYAPWDAIILDESTRIRSPKAQTTKILLRHTEHIPLRALLSGLPNPEEPMNYFTQFQFLDGHFMSHVNFWKFRQAYFYTRYTDWDWAPYPKALQRIKDYVHSNSFMLSRKAAHVGSRKIREQRTVDLNWKQRQVLREMKTQFSAGGVETKWVPVVHTWMQRVAGGFHPTTHALLNDAKIRLVEDLVVNVLHGQSVVVWFRFNNEIEAVHRWLTRRNKKLTCEYVHGAMKDSKTRRTKVQARFQKGKTRVILLQVKLGKYGWNLSRSSTAIYYSNTYELEDRSQSEDRIIHLTKTVPCLYYDLVTAGTTDEDVVEALSNKRMTARLFNTQLKQSVQKHIRAA
jgi:hypothetical protein